MSDPYVEEPNATGPHRYRPKSLCQVRAECALGGKKHQSTEPSPTLRAGRAAHNLRHGGEDVKEEGGFVPRPVQHQDGVMQIRHPRQVVEVRVLSEPVILPALEPGAAVQQQKAVWKSLESCLEAARRTSEARLTAASELFWASRTASRGRVPLSLQEASPRRRS
jgi:hypothetical protein